jgi:DNA-binding Xre family transcriptional regulator
MIDETVRTGGAMYLKLRVGELMREQGIKEGDMALRAGLARNTVRAMMRGTVKRVDFETLHKMARVLGVRPIELLGETDQEPGNGAALPLAA